MKAIVTGVSGFVGRHMAEYLLEKEYQIYAIVHEGDPRNQNIPSEIIQIHSNFLVPEKVFTDITETDHDLEGSEIYHCAALISGKQARRSKYKKVNVQSSLELAKVAVEINAAKYVFVSSLGVSGPYGSLEKPIVEETPTGPVSIYCKSKLEAEQELAKYLNKKIPLTIFRAAPVYGENPYKGAGPSKIFFGLRRSFFPIIGNGDNYVSLVYVKNLVHALYTCSKNTTNGYELFVVSDTDSYYMPDFLDAVNKYWGTSTRLIKIPTFIVTPFVKALGFISNIVGVNIAVNMEILHGMASNRYTVSMAKSRKFGYDQPYKLETAVANTCEFLQNLD